MLLLTPEPSTQQCSTEIQKNGLRTFTCYRCQNTNFENFLYDFFDNVDANSTSHRHNEIYNVVITNSHFANIHSFALPLPKKHKLKQFSLTNSSVEVIEDYAFEEFVNVTLLDLSKNKLSEISFVRTLPTRLEMLLLNDNNFESIRNVFENLVSLKHLDLSSCRLRTIDPHSFSTFTKEVFISVRNNNLTSFDVVFEDGVRLEADLSFNKIEHIDTRTKRIYFRSLNASYNNIQSISDISCQDCNYHYYRRNINVIDFSFNDLNNTNFLTALSGVKTECLNLSNANIDEKFDFETCQKYVKKKLDLSNNNIKFVTPKMFGEHFHLVVLTLFNSSIISISERGFSDCSVNVLNISSNWMTELKNHTFDNCRIAKLDISGCHIDTIEADAFLGLHLSHTLDLSRNRITYIHVNTFQNLSNVDVIDLSFNFLKTVEDGWFVGCQDLKILDLSNSGVEVIKSEAFSGDFQLRELHLENNLIKRIDFDTRSVIGVMNLQSNKFDTLEFSFLLSSSAVVVLLKNDWLTSLTNHSVVETSVVEELDLSNSKIIDIDANAFRGLRFLRLLDLCNNQLVTIHPKTFFPVKRLQRLDLSGNRIITFSQNAFSFGNRLEELGISFADATNLAQNTFITLNHLKVMNISDTKALSLEGNCFKGLIHLETLNLHNVDILNITTGVFNGLNNLQSNDFKTLFRNINIIKRGTFEGMSNPDTLDLSGLKIFSLETEAFIGLTNLKELFLQNNQLTAIVNSTFSGLSCLKTLNLSHNNIYILEMKACFGLVNLEVLSISNNNLTKLALGTFQGFPNLRVMNLHRNNVNKLLTGTFSNLKKLEDLDLSYNNKTKLKMQNLMPLIGLKRLDLTGNHLIAISHMDLIWSLKKLKLVGISGNKWQCDHLVEMLKAFRNSDIDWVASANVTFTHDNINGIKCYNICTIFYCPDEADGLWKNESTTKLPGF